MPEILTLNNSSLVKNGYKLVYGDDTVYYIHLDQFPGGIITASKLSGNRGDIITLYCDTSAGYTFNGYDITGSTLTGVQLKINSEDIYIVPSFTHNVYNINLQQTTGGTITSDKSTGYYGDTVTLSNTPAEHYGFRDYSITGATLTGNQFTINESNVTAKANFSAWPVRNVSVQQRTGGTIASNKSTGYDGDVVTLSNTADTGYTFTNYNVTGATLTGNQFAFNGGNVTAQGAFNHNVYTITLSQQTGGTIAANKTTGYYGDTITLSNTANAGYTFNSYSITGGVLTGNQFKLTGSNVTVKPNYTHNVYSLTLQTDGNGKLVAGKTTGYYNDTTTLTATPSSNYAFSGYGITGGTITNDTFKWGTSNATAKAYFNKVRYLQSFSASGYMKQSEIPVSQAVAEDRLPGNRTVTNATVGDVWCVIESSSTNFPIDSLSFVKNISGRNYNVMKYTDMYSSAQDPYIKSFAVSGISRMAFIVPYASNNSNYKTSGHIGSNHWSTPYAGSFTSTAYNLYFSGDGGIMLSGPQHYYAVYANQQGPGPTPYTATSAKLIATLQSNSNWVCFGEISAY